MPENLINHSKVGFGMMLYPFLTNSLPSNYYDEIIKQTDGKWQPAILDGKPVKVILTIPVRFELEDRSVK